MSYGFKYIAEFVNIKDVPYQLQVWQKNYTGSTFRLNLAANPVLHRYDSDEPKSPIKSSSLTINLLNEGNVHPIESFYSNEDDEFLVYLLQDSTLLFKGFLVQDDFSELMVDYTHPIKLTASDNIGLLKDVALDMTGIQAKVPCYVQTSIITVSPPNQYWIFIANSPFTPVVGTPFTISGHPTVGVDGTYTPTQVGNNGNNNFSVRVAVPVINTIVPQQCTVNGISEIDVNNNRYSLANTIYSCLDKTGLNIGYNVYCNLHEQYHRTDRSFLEQTYVDVDTFISGDNNDNCYNVLQKIMQRFGLTLFQALGEWQIVRWDEINTGTVNGYSYSPLFTYSGIRTLPTALDFGFEQDTSPQFGLTKYLSRPYEFVTETFDYKQPKYLLKNYDLQKLGLLLRTVNISANEIYKEYVATDWNGYYGTTPISERFIRVVQDALGNETARYLVIRGTTFDTARSVQSMPIEVTKGDKVNFSFQVKTNTSQPGTVTLTFAVRLVDGINNKYVSETPVDNGNWVNTIGFSYVIASGDNTNQWHTVTIKSSQIPFDGILYCYLAQITPTPQTTAKESIYKDIRLEVLQFVNDSSKIKGHVHKDLQLLSIKNNNELSISLDDSSRNTIAGTLFSPYFGNIVQRRCQYWSRIGNNDTKRIGEITTIDNLQHRSITRLKLEGTFDDIKVGSQNISMLNHFKYSLYPNKFFVFGNLEFDYRNNFINCTGWEKYDSTEADIADNYSFTYLYEI